MPYIHENFSLKELNTFGVQANARWFTEINSEDDLINLFQNPKWKTVNRLVLGGGSNILFTKDFDGLVIRINIKGIHHEVIGDDVYVNSGAGEKWTSLVMYAVDRNFAGLENLSLIPGSVGASPVQNIGAYGVEIKDIFNFCRVFFIDANEFKVFKPEDCEFGYRNSIFKNSLKGKVIITEVSFRLSLKPRINTTYGAIQQELLSRGLLNPSIKDISEVVSKIRVDKLPDPSTIGNAGSFFKNPVIQVDKFRQLQSAFPDIVHYCLPDSTIKLAAGWLIEQCGWKGVSVNGAGTWKNQALVIVNNGNATGSDIYNLSSNIINDVAAKFDVVLEREVNIM